MVWRRAPKALELGQAQFKASFVELLKTGDLNQDFQDQIDCCFEQDRPFTVSVGGVTLGGSGKTQVVKHLARILAQYSDFVFILGHGYKAVHSAIQPIIVYPKATEPVQLYGDEAVMLAHSLQNVRVVVGGSWLDKWYLAKDLGAKIIVTDGGLYTSNLPRHIGLTVLSSVDRFNILPCGHLTRPFKYWAHGYQYLLVGLCSQNSDFTMDFPMDATGCVIPKAFVHLHSQRKSHDLKFWENRRVSGICGIAKPLRFKNLLIDLGLQINDWITVPDHHQFSEQQISHISSNQEELWVTTEKDAMKFESPPQNLWQLMVELRFT